MQHDTRIKLFLGNGETKEYPYDGVNWTTIYLGLYWSREIARIEVHEPGEAVCVITAEKEAQGVPPLHRRGSFRRLHHPAGGEDEGRALAEPPAPADA